MIPVADGVQTMKQAIRQSIIATRQNLTQSVRDEFSQRITDRLIGLPIYRESDILLGYMSVGAEFSTSAWLEQAMRDGKEIWLPKVNRQTRQLDLYCVQDLRRDVAPGAWDIPEPLMERCDRMDGLADIDFILLPGVAFGRDGARLGYGGGFYDKLLERIETCRQDMPALVAAAFAMQVVDGIPMEDCDRRVDWLLTEQDVTDCSKGVAR